MVKTPKQLLDPKTSIKDLDYGLRIRNWSGIIHSGKLKGFRFSDYCVGQ